DLDFLGEAGSEAWIKRPQVRWRLKHLDGNRDLGDRVPALVNDPRPASTQELQYFIVADPGGFGPFFGAKRIAKEQLVRGAKLLDTKSQLVKELGRARANMVRRNGLASSSALFIFFQKARQGWGHGVNSHSLREG